MPQGFTAFHALSHLQQAIRQFFLEQGFLEVMAPPMVPNPGMEPHIHPFQVYEAKGQAPAPYYLHTSPEFFMKHLLSQGFEKIFTLGYCFRNEPNSDHHRPQFIMLEWYRANQRYEHIMQDCEALIDYCTQYLLKKQIPLLAAKKVQTMSVQQIFNRYLKFDLLEYLEKDQLAQLVEHRFPHLPGPKTAEEKAQWQWDDYFFLLFLNEIENKLTEFPALLLKEYPHHLSALSTLKKSDPRVCERFELYIDGIELANCYNELTDVNEQRRRFELQAQLKKQLYGYELPSPELLYNALAKGIPPSSGIALGVERLLKALTGFQNPFTDNIYELTE